MAYERRYHDESDADDEYERAGLASPTLQGDYSPTNSDATEHTPTYARPKSDSVQDSIVGWTADQCADFISNLGLEQYSHSFIDEDINGEALIELQHLDLKDLGIASVGHRLTILKGVYNQKIEQNVPIAPDHYVPLSADANAPDAHATQDDIARIIKQIQLRDERIMTAEAELRALREDVWRIQEDQRKLREDTLPVIRMAKDQYAPLPTPDAIDERPNPLSPVEPLSAGTNGSKQPGNLARKFSKKGLLLSGGGGTNLKMPSPTVKEANDLSPSAAALAASSHLTASMSSSQGPTSPTYSNQASPASPSFHSPSSSQPRPFWQQTHPSNTTSSNANTPSDSKTDSTPPNSATRPGQSTVPARRPVPTINTSQPPSTTSSAPPSSAVSSAPPTSAISGGPSQPGSGGGNSAGMDDAGFMKSFRVGMEEPCSKVLPVALKKYNIIDDWRQYSLYIVHGDQERCLGLDERPLILFKQLANEGKKPMFMLRKHGAPAAGQVDAQASRASYAGSVSLPGGVL